MKLVKRAVILAGGKGTRLRPLTISTPKALVDINGVTLTEKLLDILKKFNVTKITLSVAYLSDKVKDYFGDGKKFGVEIDYVVENEPLGTAGPFILMKKTDETMIVMNGDNLFDIDFEEMERLHIKNNAACTIALKKVDDISHFGSVDVDEKTGKILAFREKRKEQIPGWISSGYYIIGPEIFDVLKDKKTAMLETDVFPVFAKKGSLYSFKSDALWFDTGTFDRLDDVRKNWKLS